MKIHHSLLLVLTAIAAVSLTGCGGSNSPDTTPMLEEEAPPVAKLLPDLAGLFAETQSKTVPELLPWSCTPKARTVMGTQASWFRTATPTTTKNIIITVQQAPNEDSDLYLFSNWPMRSDWRQGASRRFANDTMPDYCEFGVPDWAFFAVKTTTGAGWIMVYGEAASTQTSHFRIESDIVNTLKKTGVVSKAKVGYRDSKWYRFPATSGKRHDITCTVAEGGDTDMVLYKGNSSGYVAHDFTVGSGGAISFTPNNKATHYLRVYGTKQGTQSNFSLKLTVAP